MKITAALRNKLTELSTKVNYWLKLASSRNKFGNDQGAETAVIHAKQENDELLSELNKAELEPSNPPSIKSNPLIIMT